MVKRDSKNILVGRRIMWKVGVDRGYRLVDLVKEVFCNEAMVMYVLGDGDR